MRQTGDTVKQLIISALAVSLSIAVLDASIGIIITETKFLMFRSILLPIAVTAGFSFLLLLLLWHLLGARLVKRFNLDRIPAVISLGVGIGVTELLISINYHDFDADWVMFRTKLFVFLVISIFALVISYYISKRINRSQLGALAGSMLSVLIPLILTVIMIMVWLTNHSEITAYDLSLGFFSIVLLTLGLFFLLVKTGFDTTIPLSVLMFLAVAAGPAIFVLTKEIHEPSASGFKPSSDHRVKHVILITIDTLRSDALSSYGGTATSTPNIDSLAKDGTVFKNAYSAAPWTLPSFSSMMTGVSPTVHKTIAADSMLPEKFKTIAEYLRDSGYYTAAIGDNFYLHPEFNMDQGFLEYNFYPRRQMIVDSFGATLIKKSFPRALNPYASTGELTDLAIDWIGKNRDSDFFLWVHYYDPHLPYTPPAEYISKDAVPDDSIGFKLESASAIRDGHFAPNASQRKWIKELYDAEVRYVDANLGRLLDAFKDNSLYKSSLIILTSDHGEEFWEHDGFEHGHTLYNELIHVPLIVKLPGKHSGQVVEEEVTTQSLMPTVLQLMRIPNESEAATAESLAPLLTESPSSFAEEPLVSTGLLYYENREGVIFQGSKYIESLVTGLGELYDLKNDPGEQSPLELSRNRLKSDQAKNIIYNHNRESEMLTKELGVLNTEKAALDKEKIEKLKALNYIQ
ncbi:MAG: sulfatase [Candidatus Dadabacteria bacterium]|nr:sulfatase [Candidatus Dadabacteria bacterium]